MEEVKFSGIMETLAEQKKTLRRLYHVNDYLREIISTMGKDIAKLQKEVLEQ
ncbi:MAG: hypothetical protein ACE5ES_02180 [Candidatus Nanoarchaeia archaeon]